MVLYVWSCFLQTVYNIFFKVISEHFDQTVNYITPYACSSHKDASYILDNLEGYLLYCLIIKYIFDNRCKLFSNIFIK